MRVSKVTLLGITIGALLFLIGYFILSIYLMEHW